MVPKLFLERLDDFGVDFCLFYASLGLESRDRSDPVGRDVIHLPS